MTRINWDRSNSYLKKINTWNTKVQGDFTVIPSPDVSWYGRHNMAISNILDIKYPSCSIIYTFSNIPVIKCTYIWWKSHFDENEWKLFRERGGERVFHLHAFSNSLRFCGAVSSALQWRYTTVWNTTSQYSDQIHPQGHTGLDSFWFSTMVRWHWGSSQQFSWSLFPSIKAKS